MFASILGPFAAGCSEQECVCTSDIRAVRIGVEDPGGGPARDVEIEVVRLSDGTPIPPVADPLNDGEYPVIDDFAISLVSAGGTELRVTGSRGDLGFETVLVVGTDSCGCHVEKIAGPDSVTLTDSQ